MTMWFVITLLLMSVELPSYNDSVSLPSYSCELANGERRLDYTPCAATRPRARATFIKNSGKLSVVLDNQEENATIPVFGQRALISGVVLCQRRLDDIRKIVLIVN